MLMGSAIADTVDWTSALSLSVGAGPENPLVLFGFNPQPEPPAAVITDIPDFGFREVAGVEPTPFQVFVAATGGTFDASGPTLTTDTISIGFTTDGGQSLIFRTVLDRVGGATSMIDIVSFNPQPEPPPLFDVGFAFSFSFRGAAIGNSYVGVQQVLDSFGNLLPVSAGPPVSVVPLPAGFSPLVGALCLLGLFRIKRD